MRRAAGLAYLALVVWVVWSQVPQHQRTHMRMAAWRRVQVASQGAARATARGAMRAELAGQGQRYEVPYILSVLRDKALTRYYRARGAT